jgi:hypothetical protein
VGLEGKAKEVARAGEFVGVEGLVVLLLDVLLYYLQDIALHPAVLEIKS